MKEKLLLTALCFLLLGDHVFAQGPVQPRPSPLELVTMKFENTYIKITYCRPHKNGRDIFGSLVPYGEVWRTGANEATEITVTEKIKLGGNVLEAGTYSLFSIPEDGEWTIIINGELGQWGAFRYSSEYDVLRFKISTEMTEEIYEPFTIEFEQVGLNQTNLLLIWDQTKVVIPIVF